MSEEMADSREIMNWARHKLTLAMAMMGCAKPLIATRIGHGDKLHFVVSGTISINDLEGDSGTEPSCSTTSTPGQ